MRRGFRPALLAGGVAAALLLSGCTAPRPGVTFYGNRTSAQVQPYQWCGTSTTSCTLDRNQVARITMRPNQPLQVSVDAAISANVWRVIWAFQDIKTKKVTTGSSAYLTDSRLTYRIPAFGTDQVLISAEVQRLIAATDPAGDLAFAVISSWDVVITPDLDTEPAA